MYKNYLLDACVLIPEFDALNNPYTTVLTSKGNKRKNVKPAQILDMELKENGSSLKGAKEAAKALLDHTSMHPIIITRHPLFHVWFPTESMRNPTCYYFALHHVVKAEKDPFTLDSTIVHLRDGRKIRVPVACSQFEHRWNKACIYFARAFISRYVGYTIYSRSEEKVAFKCAEVNEKYPIH